MRARRINRCRDSVSPSGEAGKRCRVGHKPDAGNAAGDAIGMHRHLQEDEILLILRGDAHVDLAGRKYEAGPGGVIFIPQGTCVAVANAGRDTLTTFFIFSAPGFEQVLREVSSRPGEPPKRLSPAERVAAFHRGHAVATPVDC